MNSSISPGPRTSPQPFGAHLRHWRQHRRLPQLDLAAQAENSTRHLSFVETGRASRSREMVLRLSQRLQVPLRERNTLLVAAGYAPMYRERPLDDPALAGARAAVDLILKGHEPYPALAVDRHWNLVTANRMIAPLLAAVDPALLQGTVNVLQLSLHPLGLARQILNLGQWREHNLERLAQQIAASDDPGLSALREELAAYPAPAADSAQHMDTGHPSVAMPLRFACAHGVLNLINTTTVFGTAVDLTLQELTLETFFPADEATAQILRGLTPMQ